MLSHTETGQGSCSTAGRCLFDGVTQSDLIHLALSIGEKGRSALLAREACCGAFTIYIYIFVEALGL